MKSKLIKLSIVSALFGGVAVSAQADNGTQYLLDREAQAILRSAESAEARRVPAFTRIDRGLTVYADAGKSGAMTRHDETRTRVLSLHTKAGDRGKVTAGHGLAPNLHRITRR